MTHSADSSSAVKLAVIGAGVMGRNHLRAAKANADVRLAGVSDMDGQRAQAAAKDFGCEAVDIDTLKDRIDAAVVAAPTAAHKSVAEPLLRGGVHCLVEKPLAASELECRALIAAAKAGNAVLQVGHIERFNPAVMAMLARNIDPKAVRRMRARRFNPGSVRVTDIGVVVDLMVHDLDIILALKRGIAVDHVSAAGNDDDAKAMITFVDGGVAAAAASRIGTERVRDLDVAFANGNIRVDYLARSMAMDSRHDDRQPLSTASLPGDAMAAQLAAFVACIRAKATPPVSGTEALEAMRLAWQIEQAMHRE